MLRNAILMSLVLGASTRLTAELRVGFGETDVTPPLSSERPVWIAGYGHGRQAEGVHDPILARCVVFDDGQRRMTWVSVDVVGLQYPTVQRIRARLPEFNYVMVSSTHNHEGPDVIGLWGRTPLHSGVDLAYISMLVDRVVEMVQKASSDLHSARAEFGTAQDDALVGDSRLPIAKDGILRVLRFRRVEDDSTLGIFLQWNCHPESLGSKNKLLTADFIWSTVAALKKRYECPIAYFTGTVGGLLAPPDDVVKDADGNVLRDGNFQYAQIYGEMVAGLTTKALENAKPLTLIPLAVATKPIAVPIANPLYKAARTLGVIPRDGRIWTGDFEQLGERVSSETPTASKEVAIESEVACLRLGELYVACIPGEIYPELVYGQFQEPAEPGADHPDAPLETPVARIMPGEKWLLLGLANDELGYIIPKRQWDQLPPYCYGRKSSQYGEINSCGPEVAPILMKALENRVRELTEK